MNRLKTVVFNTTLALNCLLLLFTIAGDRLRVPAWIQVVGRMHPLLVHFPIVMLVGFIIWQLFAPYLIASWATPQEAALSHDPAHLAQTQYPSHSPNIQSLNPAPSLSVPVGAQTGSLSNDSDPYTQIPSPSVPTNPELHTQIPPPSVPASSHAPSVLPNYGPSASIPAFQLNAPAASWFLLITAFLTSLTAVAGLLLSRETGYSPEAIAWHKYGGVLLSLFVLGWYYWLPVINIRKNGSRGLAIGAFVLVLVTGHEGSSITHGDNYLLAPVTPSQKRSDVPIEDAVVFRDMVMPILETKCLSCHSFKKAKGSLVLENQNTISKGGKTGPLFVKGQPDISLLLERIHLPDAEKKHMPPAGKPQPDDDEIAILYQWIKSGADFNRKVADLPATDTLRMLADNIFTRPAAEEPAYDFSAAPEKDIEALNNNNRQVHPIAQGSPALAAAFYNRGLYTTTSLKELDKVKKQIVALDLSYMPVKDEDIAILPAFKNLRKLNLNFGTVPGKSLSILQKLPQLEELSIAGTGLTSDDLKSLAKCQKLHTVYCWNLPVTNAQLAAIEKSNTDLHFQPGINGDSLRVRLNPPLLLTDARVVNGAPLSLKLKHFIKNSVIKYTLDGSLPDSSNGMIYKDSILLDEVATLRARAFKGGWVGSDSLVARFYKNSFRADSIRALTPLDSVYKGKIGAKTLIDGDKSDDNYGNGRWLGFRRNPMSMLLHYAQPVTVHSVSVSSVTDAAGMVMPPVTIDLWGGMSENSLSHLGRITPAQPDTIRPSTMPTYDFNFNPTRIRFLKVVAIPLDKMPLWHTAKGQKGWFFADEIFVN